MDPKEMKLPEFEYVATLPIGFDKIWKILWSVDPSRLRGDLGTTLGRIALNHQITVSKTLADLHASEAKALQDMAKELKLG